MMAWSNSNNNDRNSWTSNQNDSGALLGLGIGSPCFDVEWMRGMLICDTSSSTDEIKRVFEIPKAR